MAEITAQWNGLSAAARIGAIIGVVVAAALFACGAWWVLRDDYQVLFTDLDPRDGATIIAELDKTKVPYRLGDGGTSVLVPEGHVHKTRLKLMGKGLDLKGTVGFEIFNNADFGMTEFAQKINYQRALQGELARTIMSIDEVKHARVHLVLPESGLFKKQAAKPKASVTLLARGAGRLRAEQIAGIQRLVAAAVPEMDPGSVTVLDQQGIALSRPVEPDGDAVVASSRLELKQQTESYFVRKIAEVLDRAFGPGQAIVSVDATLNTDHIKVTREEVLPFTRRDGEMVGAVTRRRQQGTPPMAVADGAVQTATPLKETPHPVSSGPLSVEVDYESGRKVEQIVSAPGALRRLSVGVLVPANVDSARLRRIAEVVSMAVGLNTQRGDAIAVYSLDQLLAGTNGAPPNGAPSAESGAVAPPAAVPGYVAKPAMPAREADRTSPWVLGASAIVLAGLLILMRALRQRRGPVKLSEGEREAALAQIRSWLGGEAPRMRGRA